MFAIFKIVLHIFIMHNIHNVIFIITMFFFLFQLSGEEERVPAEPVVVAMVIPPAGQDQFQTQASAGQCYHRHYYFGYL